MLNFSFLITHTPITYAEVTFFSLQPLQQFAEMKKFIQGPFGLGIYRLTLSCASHITHSYYF